VIFAFFFLDTPPCPRLDLLLKCDEEDDSSPSDRLTLRNFWSSLCWDWIGRDGDDDDDFLSIDLNGFFFFLTSVTLRTSTVGEQLESAGVGVVAATLSSGCFTVWSKSAWPCVCGESKGVKCVCEQSLLKTSPIDSSVWNNVQSSFVFPPLQCHENLQLPSWESESQSLHGIAL